MHRNTKRAAKITALAATAATALMRPPPWLNAFRPACAAPSRAQDPNNLRIEIP